MKSSIVSAPTQTYPYPYLDIKISKLLALLKSQTGAGMDYHLGGKVNPLSLQVGDPGYPHGIDCSGENRWLLYHALEAQGFDYPDDTDQEPDGSVNQRVWVIQNHFKISTLDAALQSDGYIRIGFLSPSDGGGIGHVWLIHNGYTLESCGSHGPCRRNLAETGILHYGHYYVLTPPDVAGQA